MALISARHVHLSFGGPPVLEDVSLQVEKGDRIGLIGRNGVGKSALLALLSGDLAPDEGVVEFRQGLRLARLPQEAAAGLSGTAAEIVAQGAGEASVVAPYLDRLGVPGKAPVATLSGGLLRRTLLARALVGEPDVLLLDEPTNHLDLDVIEWLQSHLARTAPTLVLVTHDRALLQALATRIVEVDRGRLLGHAGGYDAYLRHRDQTLQAEAQQQAKFDKRLSQEEAWLRQGIKARRTRNEGRVRALEQMREERRRRRPETGTAKLNLAGAEPSGRLVIEAAGVTFAYGDAAPVVRDFSCRIMRGDRVGVIGPNGAGKTTLLRLLLGELAPRAGTVRHGANLRILYFDQLREQIAPDRTVRENLDLPADIVTSGGRRQHVIGYLQDFLFTPDRANQPAGALSGGERNRLLLARLFTREGNVLVLDEPTNDLDLETLDLLEELLAEFPGTLLLVTHDRTLLDRTVTSTLAVHGDGQVTETIGGYQEWRRKQAEAAAAQSARAPRRRSPREQRTPAADPPRRITYRARQELAALPRRIDELEAEQAQLRSRLGDPALYREAGEQVGGIAERLAAVEAELARLYARWEELEELSG